MQTFFHYNWMVREEWYQWCEQRTEEELLSKRIGGVGSILQTLFHIADVEWSWIRILQGKTDFQESFNDYKSLERVRRLDKKFRVEVEEFVNRWQGEWEQRLLQRTLPDGKEEIETWGNVMRHTIAHEIHHIGQLSIWSREIGAEPVSAHVIGRRLSPQSENNGRLDS